MEKQEWQPQVGDRVCHYERGLGIIEKISLDAGVPYLIKLDTGNYWWATSSTLRLISRAEKPTDTWTPKWGDEVEGSTNGLTWHGKLVYCCQHPTFLDSHIVVDCDSDLNAFSHIRPAPPKPKTLREEVLELDKDENISTYALKKFLNIIDRHEKGGENG
jgi:hypothetical protein